MLHKAARVLFFRTKDILFYLQQKEVMIYLELSDIEKTEEDFM